MPTATIVQQYKQAATSIKERVCKVLEITEEDYANKQYIQGLSYLQWYLPNHKHCRKILEADAAYWGWWKLMWNARDEVFLENLEHFDMEMEIKQRLWRELHAAYNVIGDTKPPIQVTAILFKKKTQHYDTRN
jgi:hypothetical protein